MRILDPAGRCKRSDSAFQEVQQKSEDGGWRRIPDLISFSPPAMLAPLIVGCALFMEMLDSTVISTALPAIAIRFVRIRSRSNLAITAYMLSLRCLCP